MEPNTTTQISFSSGSSALSRISVNSETFMVDATLEIEQEGSLTVFFQTATTITKIDVTAGGEAFSFTVFNTTQQLNGISFILTSPNTKQVSMDISNITEDLTITATTTNTWQVECIDEYSGSTFVTIDGSYAALPTPTIPPGKIFDGWYDDLDRKITAATQFSNITNWNIAARIMRVYAKWI